MPPFRLALRRFLPLTQTRTLARMTLIGRLAAPPELYPTSTGTDVIRYAVGVNTGTTANPSTSWFRVTSFPRSDNVKNFFLGLEKGQQVCVEADGRMNKFTPQGEEGERKVFELRHRNLELVGPRPSGGNKGAQEEEGTANLESEAGGEAAGR